MTACRVTRHGVSKEESWVVVSQKGIFLCTTTQISVRIKDRYHKRKSRKFLILKSSACLLEMQGKTVIHYQIQCAIFLQFVYYAGEEQGLYLATSLANPSIMILNIKTN